MTPIELRALAERVRTEEASWELNACIWEAVGLTRADEAHFRMRCKQEAPGVITRRSFLLAYAPRYIISIDAATTAMSKGWRVRSGELDNGTFYAFARHPNHDETLHFNASTEPRARTALALEVLATMQEMNHG